MASKNDDSVSEKLDQTPDQPFLDEHLEESEGNTIQMKTVEEQAENEVTTIDHNEKYETLEMESCENTVDVDVGEEGNVTEFGQVCEKSDETLTQLSTVEEITEKGIPAAHDDEKGENLGEEVCEDSITVVAEEKKSEVVEKEGRRGSVGSKGQGRGGGNKSGSKQKKKKRKIL